MLVKSLSISSSWISHGRNTACNFNDRQMNWRLSEEREMFVESEFELLLLRHVQSHVTFGKSLRLHHAKSYFGVIPSCEKSINNSCFI